MSDFEITDLSSNHIYRTELPNLIFEIGLNPTLIGVYAAIKRCSGDSGSCFKSEKTLAQELNISKSSLHKYIEALCEENSKLKIPLLVKVKRVSECGDNDTNLITITDLWPENYAYFSTKEWGRVKSTLPRVKSTLGVGYNLPKGRVKSTHKEELTKKNPLKKKTTTTNKSKSSSFSEKISEETKQAAKKAFEHVKQRSEKDDDEKWNIDLITFEKCFHLYGILFSTDQLNYLFERMNKYRKNKNKPNNKIHQIDDPKTYFEKACSENYAKSLNLKEK